MQPFQDIETFRDSDRPICMLLGIQGDTDSPRFYLVSALYPTRRLTATYDSGWYFPISLFKQLRGTDIGYVPFHGSYGAHPAIMGHHVDMTMSYFADSKGLIRAGKLRALAEPSKEWLGGLPETPTFGELGYRDIVFDCWYGPAFRKGVTEPILDKLRHAFSVAAQGEETRKEIEKTDFMPFCRNHEDSEKFVEAAFSKYKGIARKASIKPEAFHELAREMENVETNLFVG